jgi:VWFA-related protein
VGASAAVALQGQQTPQRPPVFRTDVDVIRLDVSVLDKNRRPVRGLTMADFSVTEDGKPQRIVAVAEVDVAEHDPAPTAWMRHVPPDISTNDLVDQLGDGRLYAIVMDDVNVPWDDLDIIQSARTAGRYIVDGLGPSDVAAVVFPRDAGLTQDFTTDRSRLLRAIDQFDPREPDLWIPPRPPGPGGGGGDMPYRFSPALMRTECERAQPTVPTLEVVARRLATVPNRRKTLILVSVGLPLTLTASRGCAADLAHQMREVFRIAQQANINIHGVDPAGYRGYEQYLMNPIRRGGRPARVTMQQPQAENAARTRREFLEITAEYTGARAVVGLEGIEPGIDRIFEEDGSYYLLGYQTSNPKPDGKFRRTVVRVNRPGLTVRTRSGYFAPQEGSLATREQKQAPSSNELGLTGMTNPTGLPLRVSATAIGLSGPQGRTADVALALSVRLPPSNQPIDEQLTLVRNLYDADGRTSQPVQEKIALTVTPSAGDELRYDVLQRLRLEPGRYEVRLNAASTALKQSGTVFADIEVPDFTRAPIVMSGIVFGRGAAPERRTDVLASIVPIVPTSAREFSPNEQVTAFVRLFQNASPAGPVAMKVMVLDINDNRVLDTTSSVAADAFATDRAAEYRLDLPLAKMQHGPHLLSITATLPNGASARRDVVFRAR